MILATRALIEDERVIRRHRLLSLTLIVLVLAIMASAMLRMRLYIGYFGLTTDRLYATAVMVWLGLVSLAMARTVLRGWSRPFAAMTMVSAFVTLFMLNAINPDVVVARVNLGRTTSEQGVDFAYLARLSGDAAPMVVQALKTAAPSVTSCTAVRSLLAKWPANEDAAWNLGGRRGRDAVVRNLSATDELRLCAGVPDVPAAPVPVVR
jgi:hypothetical protein